MDPPLAVGNRLRNSAEVLKPLVLGIGAPDGDDRSVAVARDDAPIAILGD
jgi:hypothetical protein